MTSDLPSRNNSFEFLSSRTVSLALQALSPTTKQVIRVTITSRGVHFRCEDPGKTCQSSVRFPEAFFTSFDFTGTPSTFSVRLSELLDALRVFSSLPGVAVTATETSEHLVLETAEEAGGVTTSMYAHITILATTVTRDFSDAWQTPATQFVTSAVLLREAIEDLEWPQGPVRIAVLAQPFQVTLSSKGSVGTLEVSLPAQHLRQCSSPLPSIAYRYPYKFMKPALSGMAAKADVPTEVSIDANGLFRVVHMMRGPRGMSQAPESQANGGDVVLTYMIQSVFDEDDEEDVLN